jgi:ABC-2 type transport system permease protein
VGTDLYDVIRVITALFPFNPALHAMTSGLDSAGPSLGTALLHLAALIVAYGVIARLALRRFTAI